MKNEIKKICKLIPGFNYINNLRKELVFKQEFLNDYKFFKNNFVYAKRDAKRLDYEMILIIHSLEKGMANKKLRPFGVEKVKKLIYLVKYYENITDNFSYAYNLAISCLNEYKRLYTKNNWLDKEEYSLVSNFLECHKDYSDIKAGAFDLIKKDFINESKIDYDAFLASRHSVRNFSNKTLKTKDIIEAVNTAIKSPSACNRQMCKVYFINDDQNKKEIEKISQGLGGFDLSNANYFIITFDIAANYFVGERNQGWFNAGLFSMNFVNALHSLGIGTCFMQFGNTYKEEELLKEKLNISISERIAVVIVAGYYDEISKIPYSTRKNITDIYFER